MFAGVVYYELACMDNKPPEYYQENREKYMAELLRLQFEINITKTEVGKLTREEISKKVHKLQVQRAEYFQWYLEKSKVSFETIQDYYNEYYHKQNQIEGK